MRPCAHAPAKVGRSKWKSCTSLRCLAVRCLHRDGPGYGCNDPPRQGSGYNSGVGFDIGARTDLVERIRRGADESVRYDAERDRHSPGVGSGEQLEDVEPDTGRKLLALRRGASTRNWSVATPIASKGTT
jgi:hypothetical protein